MSDVSTADLRTVESVTGDCAATLQRLAGYRLPAALDQRLLWLSENKESLTEPERHEWDGTRKWPSRDTRTTKGADCV